MNQRSFADRGLIHRWREASRLRQKKRRKVMPLDDTGFRVRFEPLDKIDRSSISSQRKSAGARGSL
jgi:hypothetical protein